MTFFQIISGLLAIAALTAYVNEQYIKWPSTIWFVVVSLVGSLVVIALGATGIVDVVEVKRIIESVNFNDVVFHGLLAFLLFAGALNVDLSGLRATRWEVTSLATLGVVMATFIIGSMFWLITRWLEIDIPFIYALVFGALISPTDPVAVLGILKTVTTDKRMEALVAGESLFNDGTAVVVFTAIAGVAAQTEAITFSGVSVFFAREVLGGIGLGLVLGWIAFRLMRSVDAYKLEVLITLALASEGYALALAVGVSGPITVIIAGLIVGNQGRRHAMSETTRIYLDHFWELVDEILNAVLFILIGLEVITLTLKGSYILAGLLAVAAVLLGRAISVAIPVNTLRLARHRGFPLRTIPLLTWSGLRGGISIALALSLHRRLRGT